MAYDRDELFSRVRAALAACPTCSLKSIASELNVSRHTLTRAVRRLEGVTFRQLRLRAIADTVATVRSRSRPLIGKELAARAGFRSQRRLTATLKHMFSQGRPDRDV